MKNGSILFLKVIILLLAIGVGIWLIWFPQLEGRATNLDLISIYKDPLIIYGYITSIPFFIGLYQALKLLHYIEGNKAFSKAAINTLNNIKLSAVIFLGFIVSVLVYIRLFVHGDDSAGPTALGILASFTAIVIAATATVFQKLLQEGNLKKL